MHKILPFIFLAACATGPVYHATDPKTGATVTYSGGHSLFEDAEDEYQSFQQGDIHIEFHKTKKNQSSVPKSISRGYFSDKMLGKLPDVTKAASSLIQ